MQGKGGLLIAIGQGKAPKGKAKADASAKSKGPDFAAMAKMMRGATSDEDYAAALREFVASCMDDHGAGE